MAASGKDRPRRSRIDSSDWYGSPVLTRSRSSVGHWTISTGGGTRPLWARSGTELFYLDGAGAMMRVPVQTTPTFSAGTPAKVFDTRYFIAAGGRAYDVSPDGQRFLMIKAAGTEQAPTMVVVLNWLEELKAKLPAK